ncbi:hypothetical protein PV963_29460 [Streptomyces coeruleorubidus]|uniref:hypothetical protein n=1 Tax=Streptomyces coeruleorubidus TaxID=116188 RepID=UPI00237FD64F|nr:hypothetical protein [Streptomyces coeruleorubidus]WDV54192.1 hypothetical protein PV963_29460 [Streptomyces coeruleorubidus]
MGTPTIILHDSFRDPQAELWFIEPPGFTTLPLDALLPEPGSPAADELRAVAAPFLDSAPNEMFRQQFIANFSSAQKLLAALRDVGMVHCSIGMHHDDTDKAGSNNGQPLLSWFTVSWLETPVSPRGVMAARALTSSAPSSGSEYLELACGPATFSETVITPPADSGLPLQSLLQMRVHLPHPDCKRLAVLTVSTTATSHREEYRAILRQIAESVSFDNPLEEDPIRERDTER